MDPREYKFKTLGIGVLSALCLVLSACSEDKCPPDDNSAQGAQQKAQMTSAVCLARADEFHACALAAIEAFELTDNERTSLSLCSYQQASPETTSLENFLAARDAVAAHCVSY